MSKISKGRKPSTSVRLPQELMDRLDAIAARLGVDRTAVIRTAAEGYATQQEMQQRVWDLEQRVSAIEARLEGQGE